MSRADRLTRPQNFRVPSWTGVGRSRADRLTRDELLAEAGERRRACLCASWELAAVGRCVCPEAIEDQAGGHASPHRVKPCPAERRDSFTRSLGAMKATFSKAPPGEGAGDGPPPFCEHWTN